MIRRGFVVSSLTCVCVLAALAYLRDPAWLIGIESGFRSWETAADGTRFRWTGGHASFFVRSDAAGITVPIRTTFSSRSDGPVTVAFTIDDRPAERQLLTDDAWHRVRLVLPAGGSRRVRRIDIRVNPTRSGNRGVQVGETLPR
jgi:hypothetical protein